MNGPMAASAHEDQVAEARFAALDPVLEVVGVSPAGGAAAAWELAVAISQHQCLAQRRRDHPGRPAHAQNLRAGTQLDPGPPPPASPGTPPTPRTDSAGEREASQAIRRAISPGTGWPLSSSAGGAPGSELNVAICATSIRCGR